VNKFVSTTGKLHAQFVFNRRVNALASQIQPLLPNGKILDVGTGSGDIASVIQSGRQDVQIYGVDVLVRGAHAIQTVEFDGYRLPFADQSFDAIMIVDVLHHTDDFVAVLQECARVSPVIIIKDHFQANPIDYLMLRTLDWVGNASHGVRLPYNYFTRSQWENAIDAIKGAETHRQESVYNLYPFPFQKIIGERIQFISKIEIQST